MENTKEKRVWNKDEIKELLIKSDKMVQRSLLVLYNAQTELEQEIGQTAVTNGVGFNKVDSALLTSLAQWYLDKQFLTDKQIATARKRLIKYSKQLANYANTLG